MESISWKLIDTYFKDNPYNLVAHHLESYNDFFSSGINQIFKVNNPIRYIDREEDDKSNKNTRKQMLLYLGGKNGDKIYFGKPIIYDESNTHYMYPNDARLRNMNYGTTIHYDVDVEIIYFEGEERKEHTTTLEKIYLGKFPIMLQSNMCILKDLSTDVRFNMGECRNDYGGYFIIDGKEKVIVSQEKFADNMLYIRKNKSDDIYSFSAEVRSVSEDSSKPQRTMAIKIMAPSTVLSNNQIVVAVPNVKKPVPLFILMRALGVISDKEIIEYCLLDMNKNKSYVDLFIPSIHDANKIFTQETAIKYIASFTKRRTITGVLDILMNYFLPHIGEDNFLDKAYYVGFMVNKLLRVYTGEDKPTDRDNFRFKRLELSGSLIYDLFREYYLIQKREIALKIDSEYYFHKNKYEGNFFSLIDDNYLEFFKDRTIETGFKKAFKGNWGSEARTKRVGVIQDLNRLSWNTFISQLRKSNLPLDASAKVVGPRLLHSSQWGYIDPVDTPDGGNIGLHKHLAISAAVSSGYSSEPLIKWIRAKTDLKILQECNPKILSENTKVLVNGNWIGVIDNPIETIKLLKLFKRNGLLPIYTSISFNYEHNEMYIYCDSGRLTRPIYYMVNDTTDKTSFQREIIKEKMEKGDIKWEEIVAGFKQKSGDENFNIKRNKIYDIGELYPSLNGKSVDLIEKELVESSSMVDYIDTAEEDGLMIANNLEDIKKYRFYTNIEIDSSFLLGVLGNLVIYPENNQFPRNAFSCGQSKQAVSVYHSNYQMRIDKMGVILNYGQTPLLKSRYLNYFNKEEQPYGINAIVAIMCYTGYNVEDAILINEGSVKRGIFRTSYYNMYESRETSDKIGDSTSSTFFANLEGKNVVGIKEGYDYSQLDVHGLIKENTPLNDETVLIGMISSNSEKSDVFQDSSVFPKKGQLGFVDKVFITEGEQGFRLAKVRVREERVPAIGDKMASRCGQKGTLGLIIPENDMPFTSDGTRPDLIINPHALPSRMTIGQLVESLFGKACTYYGGYGDCTAFATKGPNTEVYGEMLVNAGFHSSGNQIMYNGMTGEQIYSEIYMGPTYYMRLKHMVKDKINYRAKGPRTVLTRQTVQGRANDGGLRLGEMERDGVMAHGASAFLNDSYMNRGDEYYMAVCNKTGCIAVYNPSINLFMSPFVDGPVKFNYTLDGKMNVENISKFGRSFSIVRVPYALKLLIQELQVMNVQMRIITEDNIDQLLSMSYSDNINKLLKLSDDEKLTEIVDNYKKDISLKIVSSRNENNGKLKKPVERPEYPNFESKYEEPKRVRLNIKDPTLRAQYEGLPEREKIMFERNIIEQKKLKSASDSASAYNDKKSNSPQYAPVTPPYSPGSPQYAPGSPQYAPGSPQYAPGTPPYAPGTPPYAPGTPPYAPGTPPYAPGTPPYPSNSSENEPISILEVEEKKEENKEEENVSTSTNGDKKTISFDLKPGVIEEGETKKINLI
uniref:DNA-directed RNA polymerase n=1 Tax=viral metagenome TaxID=1070528 RepID=A0A6C0KY36_9ZZZZ